jgi:hypothetical protein
MQKSGLIRPLPDAKSKDPLVFLHGPILTTLCPSADPDAIKPLHVHLRPPRPQHEGALHYVFMPIDLLLPLARKVMLSVQSRSGGVLREGMSFIEMVSRPVCMPLQSTFNDGVQLPLEIVIADQEPHAALHSVLRRMRRSLHNFQIWCTFVQKYKFPHITVGK